MLRGVWQSTFRNLTLKIPRSRRLGCTGRERGGLGHDFETRGRSTPWVEAAAGVQTAAMFAYALGLLLAESDDAGFIARIMRAWVALIDPCVRWVTFFGPIPFGGPDGRLAILHRHLLAACVLGLVFFLLWTRRYREIWTRRLFVKLLRIQRTEAKIREIAIAARRQAALGAFGAAMVVLLSGTGSGVGWYFFLAPLASGTTCYCLAHFIILGGLGDGSPKGGRGGG